MFIVKVRVRVRVRVRVILSQGVLLLVCIQSMNLDTFWRQAQETVTENKSDTRSMIEPLSLMRIQGYFDHDGSYLPRDR